MKLSRLAYYPKRLYLQITTSIAFYPALLALLMIILAWGCMYIDRLAAGGDFVDLFSFLDVRHPDTARSLLSTIAAGLITLMVFSFTMVMVVLNQAATNYSPRVLPGLVSYNEHQVVLGIFLGTIAYTLVVLSNIQSEALDVEVPSFSIVVNLMLAVVSFGAFVYFIHEISNVIQIGNILMRLYHKTRNTLLKELSQGTYVREAEFPEERWQPVEAWQSGYFFKIAENSFLKDARHQQFKVRLLKYQGDFLIKGEPFLEINQPINEELQNVLVDNFIFQHKEIIRENYFYGFKQISEVAMKGLSPGINDPGTALQAINYLSDLFQILLGLKGRKVLRQQDGTISLVFPHTPVEEILYFSLSGIRNYALQDIVVQVRLIELIGKLRRGDKEGTYDTMLKEELEAIEEGVSKSLKSSKDLAYIRQLLKAEKKPWPGRSRFSRKVF